MAGIDFKQVSASVSCKDIAEAEGLDIRGGRIRCPFHGGTHYNFRLGGDGRDGRGYCFVCHKYADSIGLASVLWNVDAITAAREIDARWKLGLDGERVTRDELERRRRDRERARAAEAEAKRQEAVQYSAVCDELRHAEDAMLRFGINDAGSQTFDQALERLGRAQLAYYAAGGR